MATWAWFQGSALWQCFCTFSIFWFIFYWAIVRIGCLIKSIFENILKLSFKLKVSTQNKFLFFCKVFQKTRNFYCNKKLQEIPKQSNFNCNHWSLYLTCFYWPQFQFYFDRMKKSIFWCRPRLIKMKTVAKDVPYLTCHLLVEVGLFLYTWFHRFCKSHENKRKNLSLA